MADLASTTALLSLFSDPTRVRLMALLSDEELTVAEIVRITGLTQSRVSTHLGRLREGGLLLDRRVGVSTFYRVNEAGMPEEARHAWALIRGQLRDGVLLSDAKRRVRIVAARTDGSSWADQVAGRMEDHYSPGRTWEATTRGVLGLLELGDVLDVGSGDGVLAALLAPRSRTFTCLDRSARVIEAARERLQLHTNIRLVEGDMQSMPLADASFDQVLLFHVLTHAERPRDVLNEAFRVSRPGGTIVVVTLDEHTHEDIAATYQHVNRGFSPAALETLLNTAGFSVSSCEVSSRERRKPYFQIVTAFGRRPAVSAANDEGPTRRPVRAL